MLLQVGLCILVIVPFYATTDADLITDENQASQWLQEYNIRAQDVYSEYVNRYWKYYTNLTDHNQQIVLEGSVIRANFRKEAYTNTTLFDWRAFTDTDLKRQFTKVADIGTSVLTEDDLEEYETLNTNMEATYSVATVCKNATYCLPLDPDLTNILANSRDWDELEWAWKGWREQSGKKIKGDYVKFVELQNKAAKLNQYEDTGDYWRSWYEDKDFETKCLDLFNQVKPLYQQLHAYVKRKLKENYSDRKFPESGHIPAHLLGNMWAQQWSTLLSLVTPYKDVPSIDVTQALVDQNYDAMRIFNVSEEFFTSLGLKKMPDKFWEHSMIVKPEDRKVVCHASAWDFYNGEDFRIKQCTDITQKWLITTHHEMGHVQYYLQYQHLPVVYRRGGNPGFHEAVGDVLALSVSTPEHLKLIGLLDDTSNNINEDEYDINFLMGQALDKISFIPFGYLIDQWRWSVFKGETSPADYNKKWWELRCKHQGISPPVERADNDFDPGAKFHIPSNTPYIRYFVSYIIQFQFHKSLCDAANYTGPLHRCDIYNSKAAGTLLGNMLAKGSSKPWPEAMEAITGQREMDASALMDFFKPLTTWLENENKGQDITWEDACPTFSTVDGATCISGGLSVLLLPVMLLFTLF